MNINIILYYMNWRIITLFNNLEWNLTNWYQGHHEDLGSGAKLYQVNISLNGKSWKLLLNVRKFWKLYRFYKIVEYWKI